MTLSTSLHTKNAACTFFAALIISLCAIAYAQADLSGTAGLASLNELIKTNTYTNGLPESVKLGPGAAEIFFLRSGPEDALKSLYSLTLSTGITRKLVDPSDLGGGGHGLTSFQLSMDGKEILVPYIGKIFLVRVSDRRLLAFGGTGYLDPQLSPDGELIAAVKNDDLVVIDTITGQVKPLTTGGTPVVTNGLSDTTDLKYFGRVHGFWWSPNSRQIAYVHTDLRSVIESHIVDLENPQSVPVSVHIPLPGTPYPVVRLGIVSVAGGRTVWAKYDNVPYCYVVRVIWRQPKAPLSVVLLNSSQLDEELVGVQPWTGAVDVLLEEHAGDLITTAPDNAHRTSDLSPYWLSDGSGFLWLSQEHGDWQIEVRDRHGALVRTVTPLGLHVRGIDDINERTGVITFEASSDPRQCQIYKTDFRGSAAVPITHTVGIHMAAFSPDHTIFGDSYSLADGEIGTDIFSNLTEFRLARLPSLADAPPSVPNVRFFRLGPTSAIDAAVIYPSNFVKEKHYPAILWMNSELGTSSVTTGISSYADSQWYANHGFLVINVDGRGAPDRGRLNEMAVRSDTLLTLGHDQLAALIELEKLIPQLDFAHIAVAGQGVGGAVAIDLLSRHPDVFSCGVSISPVSDWTMIDKAFAERYLDAIEEDETGYVTNSIINNTQPLVRHLLLLAGTSTTDLSFASSLRLAEKFDSGSEPVNFVPFHPAPLTDTRITDQAALHEQIVQFLLDHLTH